MPVNCEYVLISCVFQNFGNNITLDDLSKTTDYDMQSKIDDIIKGNTNLILNRLDMILNLFVQLKQKRIRT